MHSMFAHQSKYPIYLRTSHHVFFLSLFFRLDLLKHLPENKGFAIIMPSIFIIQMVFTVIGGRILRTVPLTASEWIQLVLLSCLIIPFDLGRKWVLQKTKIGRRLLGTAGSDSLKSPDSGNHKRDT